MSTDWLDIKQYVALIFTVKATGISGLSAGDIKIEWGQGRADEAPTKSSEINSVEHISVSVPAGQSRTYQTDTRMRWVRVINTIPDSVLSVSYKLGGTEIKIAGPSATSTSSETSIVAVKRGDTNNALTTVMRDSSLNRVLRTTATRDTSLALFTTLTSSDGRALGTTMDASRALFVAAQDICGRALSSTGRSRTTDFQRNDYLNPAMDVIFIIDAQGWEDTTLNVSLDSAITVTASGAPTNTNVFRVGTVTGGASDYTGLVPGLYDPTAGRFIRATDNTAQGRTIVLSGPSNAPSTLNFTQKMLYPVLVDKAVNAAITLLEPYMDSSNVQVGAIIKPDMSQGLTSDSATVRNAITSLTNTIISRFDLGPPEPNYVYTDICAALLNFTLRDPAIYTHKLVIVKLTDLTGPTNADVATMLDENFDEVCILSNIAGTSSYRNLVRSRNSRVDLSAYMIKLDEADKVSDVSMGRYAGVLADVILGDAYNVKGALCCAPTDVSGHAQAGVLLPSSQRPVRGSTALAYALSDSTGTQLATTVLNKDNPDLKNALYVHIVRSDGALVTDETPLHIQERGKATVSYCLDTSLNGQLRTLVDVNSALLSGKTFQLNSLHLANEGPESLWLKIYDMYDAAGQVGLTYSYDYIDNFMKLNVHVPTMGFRDLTFERGIIFKNGMMARASTQSAYNAGASGDPGLQTITVQATYAVDAVWSEDTRPSPQRTSLSTREGTIVPYNIQNISDTKAAGGWVFADTSMVLLHLNNTKGLNVSKFLEADLYEVVSDVCIGGFKSDTTAGLKSYQSPRIPPQSYTLKTALGSTALNFDPSGAERHDWYKLKVKATQNPTIDWSGTIHFQAGDAEPANSRFITARYMRDGSINVLGVRKLDQSLVFADVRTGPGASAIVQVDEYTNPASGVCATFYGPDLVPYRDGYAMSICAATFDRTRLVSIAANCTIAGVSLNRLGTYVDNSLVLSNDDYDVSNGRYFLIPQEAIVAPDVYGRFTVSGSGLMCFSTPTLRGNLWRKTPDNYTLLLRNYGAGNVKFYHRGESGLIVPTDTPTLFTQVDASFLGLGITVNSDPEIRYKSADVIASAGADAPSFLRLDLVDDF